LKIDGCAFGSPLRRAKGSNRRFNSRNSNVNAQPAIRLASCALAQLYEYWRREGPAFGDQGTVAKPAE
jgi:hypothetical protein